MSSPPVDQKKPENHHETPQYAQMTVGHGADFQEPTLQMIGRSKIRQPFEETNEPRHSKKIPVEHPVISLQIFALV
jgi:hypothetical protein